ncbi:MAG: permease-like cell division protein FtsX [Tannerella sp.]|nr:permease-like cell division protein FtsX [Tannerella sp.]
MATNKRRFIPFFNSQLISVVSISLVLFLLGIILIITFLGKELSHYVKEHISISMVLNEDLNDRKINTVRSELEKERFVKATEYISKEQASREMQEELGEKPETFLGFNPFKASIEVYLMADYTHPDSLAMVKEKLAKYGGVSSVEYPKDMMQTVNRNIRRISLILLTLLSVLIVISYVLISNTVKLMIYSKRFLIYTMRLVGATPNFIRQPFLRLNLFAGLIAGVIAIIMLWLSLYYLKNKGLDINEIIILNTMLLIYALILAAGVMISVMAAYFAVNKYLKMARGKLYYI